MKSITSRLCMLLLLSSCVGNRITDKDRAALYQNYVSEHKLQPLKSIAIFRFDGWRDLGKEHLIIFTSIKKPYLISLRSRCVDLYFSQTIGINQTGSSLNARMDSIFVLSFPEQKCFIKSIYKLTKEQADQLSDLYLEEKEKRAEQADSNN